MEHFHHIVRFSQRGEGVVEQPGTRHFIPFTLPGEKVRMELDGEQARQLEIIHISPERVTPPCIHFGVCGGCDLQHASDKLYADFKTSLLHDMLCRLGVSETVTRPLERVPASARRRAEFAVACDSMDRRVGFTRRRSHDVFNLTMCPVMRPEIVALLPRFRDCLAALPKPGRVISLGVEALVGGFDLRIGWKGKFGKAERRVLCEFAEAVAAQRLSVCQESETETLHDTGETIAEIGGVPVEWPVGGFRQATAEGEAAILACIMRAISSANAVADIYAGGGAYSLPLARAGHRVSAWEGDETMIAALQNAARRAALDHRLDARMRDLHRDPLLAETLRRFDAVVINPPRNGAGPQMAQIAESAVRRVAVVSCNPVTFERDARALLAQGYRLIEATPIDQFLWSHHLELVACFEKA